MATRNYGLIARDIIGQLRLASAYTERALLRTLSPGAGVVFLALGFAAMQMRAASPYVGIWVIGVLAIVLAAVNVVMPRRVSGDFWLAPLSLTLLFATSTVKIAVLGAPLTAPLTVALAVCYGALVLMRRVALSDATIFILVGPIFITAPDILAQAQAQGWFWYEITIALVMTLAGGAVIWRGNFLSGIVILYAFSYYSLLIPLSMTPPAAAAPIDGASVLSTVEASYRNLLRVAAPSGLIAATWTPFVGILAAMHWFKVRDRVSSLKAFLDQYVVSGALGVVVVYALFTAAPQIPIRYVLDASVGVMSGWLLLLLAANRERWAPYGAFIWLIVLERVAAHLAEIDISVSIALYAAATIGLAGALLVARLMGVAIVEAARQFAAFIVGLDIIATLNFVALERLRRIGAGLEAPELQIAAPLYGLILFAIALGLAAIMLETRGGDGLSPWRGQVLSARSAVFARRAVRSISTAVANVPILNLVFGIGSAINALMRHLRGDARKDLASNFAYVMMLIYLGWATLRGPVAPFISALDPTGATDGARLIQFGLLSYLIGRLVGFRLFSYAGVAAILWSAWETLSHGLSGAAMDPVAVGAQVAAIEPIAGTGASTALILRALAEVMGPKILLPGIGLIACEVLRALVDPARERLSTLLATRGSGADARPSAWVLPTAGLIGAAAAALLVVSVASRGATFTDAMSNRSLTIAGSVDAAVMHLAALPEHVPLNESTRFTLQRIDRVDTYRAEAGYNISGVFEAGAGAEPFQILVAPHQGGMRLTFLVASPQQQAGLLAALTQPLRRPHAVSGNDPQFAALKAYLQRELADLPALDITGLTISPEGSEATEASPTLYVAADATLDDEAARTLGIARIDAVVEASGVSADEPMTIYTRDGQVLIARTWRTYYDGGEPTPRGGVRVGETPVGKTLSVFWSGPAAEWPAARARALAAIPELGLTYLGAIERHANYYGQPNDHSLEVYYEGSAADLLCLSGNGCDPRMEMGDPTQ